jgi:hypothetical protein
MNQDYFHSPQQRASPRVPVAGRFSPHEPAFREHANASFNSPHVAADRSPAWPEPNGRYDAVDRRLIDTFPASDAVARY